MARRAFYKGVIQIGPVSVPVKLYSALEDRDIHFHMLHDQDQVRLQQQMVCLAEDKPVDRDDLVKGLQVDEGEYVRVDPEELAELAPESARTIDIDRFVPPEQIDPRYFDRPYHLGPDGDLDAYRLLRRALDRTGRAGTAHWVMRKREYHGVLKLTGRTLTLVTLRYPDEIADVGQLDLPRPKVKSAERKTARYLIDELTEEFDPDQYTNVFRRRVAELVRRKAEGKQPPTRKVREEAPEAPADLQAALEESLARARKRKSSKKSGSKGKTA